MRLSVSDQLRVKSTLKFRYQSRGLASRVTDIGVADPASCGRVQEPAPVHELVTLALEGADSGWTPDDGPKQDLAQYVTDLLTSKADMLADYFSLEIDSVRGWSHAI